MTALFSPSLRWWQLTWPRSVELDQLDVGLRHLAGSRQVPVLLRSEGAAGRVRHLVAALTNRPVRLLGQHLSGARVDLAQPAVLGTKAQLLRLRFSTRQRRIGVPRSPLTAATLIQALAETRHDEHLVLEWVLLAPLAAVAVPSRAPAHTLTGWSQALIQAPFTSPGMLDPEARQALAEKRSAPGWRALGRLSVEAATEKRRQVLASTVLGALRALESPDLRLHARRGSPSALGTASPLSGRPVALSTVEVPWLVGWPVGELGGLPVSHAQSRQLAAHPAMPRYRAEWPGRLVAVGQRDGSERALVLGAGDAARHLHVLGPTGAGKSTLLLRIITADMAAGRSVVVFDPKGDLVSAVLARVPEGRRDDVVVLDPTDRAPVGLNPLAGGTDPELVADGLLGTLHELFASSWGVRTQDIMHAGLLTLARHPEASLALLPVLLTNPGYRARLTRGLDDPFGVGGFWAQYEALSEAERRVAIQPVINKLRQLLNRSSLRAVIGQLHPRFELASVFREPRIVLVNLATGLLGSEGSALFGALVWARLWRATQAQAAVPSSRRRPVFVYADEFQEYLKTPVSFSDMLVQARSYGVSLTMAHQHLGQLGLDVRDTVLSNVGSRVTFQLLANDAATLSRLGTGLEAADIAGLGAYEVYANLRVGGEASGWMSGRSLPPTEPVSDAAALRRRSAERYGVPREETEAALRVLLNETPGSDPRTPVGVKRRKRGDA